MKRLATLVGCNYGKEPYALQGCFNDVDAIRRLLTDRFHFRPDDITVLTDAGGSANLPTGDNIKAALKSMVGRAEDGDLLFFHFSGCGTMDRTETGGVWPAIVPCDSDLINSKYFQEVVNRVPKGVTFTFTSDSSYSGQLIHGETEQIGASDILASNAASSYRKRSLPYMAAVSAPFLATSEPIWADLGIQLSACRSDEEALELGPEKAGGNSYGAFTYALLEVLQKNPTRLSSKALVTLARENLQAKGISQHPCLYCSTDETARLPFLLQ